MRRSTPLALLAVLGLLLAACGQAGDGSPQVGAIGATTTSEGPHDGASVEGSGGSLDMIVAPDENGSYPSDLVVACSNGPSFPVGALDEVATVDTDDPDGMLAAIAPFLESEEGAQWPQENWLLLHEDPGNATLAALQEESVAFMYLERAGSEWVWSGSSISGDPCDLRYTVPDGLNTVEWRLDPDEPPPISDNNTLQVLITERECVGGQAIGDRLVGPQVVMTDTSVLIAFAAEPPPGDAFNCQGNPETPYTVELPQPLGDREIIEGTSIGLTLRDFLR